MSKRSRDNFAEGGSGSSLPSPKRSRADSSENDADALAAVAGNAKELLSYVDALRSRDKNCSAELGDSDPGAKERLLSLSDGVSSALEDLRRGLRRASSDRDGARVSESEQSLQGRPEARPRMMMSVPVSITAWTVADISEELPPLPQVLDPTLEAAALTHSGSVRRPTAESYERLEWIGDAYLFAIASSLIYRTFDDLLPGKCSQLREMLVRNTTLAAFSQSYNLHQRANFPPEYGLQGREGGTAATKHNRTKALGDIFEAYVGAVILSDPERGMSRVTAWLKSLWSSVIARHIREKERSVALRLARSQEGGEAEGRTDLPPKTQLSAKIVVPGVKLRYEDMNSGKKKYNKDNAKLELFTVGVFLDGWGETNKQLGWGTAESKKKAGQKAAQLALDNRKLMKKYSEKKKDFLEATKGSEAMEGIETPQIG